MGNFPLALTSLQMNKFYLPLFALFLFCQNLEAQVDTVPPVLVCSNNISVTITPTCLVTVWASDVVDTVYDDTQPIELGIRKPCVGSGFPSKKSTTFTSSYEGTQTVEVWARDNSGNSTSCTTTIWVQNFGSCEGWSYVDFFAYTPKDESINQVKIKIDGQNCLGDTVDIDGITDKLLSPITAYYKCYEYPKPGYDLIIEPSRNFDPLNGVTSYDLALISKHILGIEPFDSPYKIIAADANQDGKVTTFDIILLRRLILGLSNTLPNGKSWRFVPWPYVFPNPENPFQPAFPEKGVVPNTADLAPSDFRFIGVKIGDVNYSADPD